MAVQDPTNGLPTGKGPRLASDRGNPKIRQAPQGGDKGVRRADGITKMGRKPAPGTC